MLQYTFKGCKLQMKEFPRVESLSVVEIMGSLFESPAHAFLIFMLYDMRSKLSHLTIPDLSTENKHQIEGLGVGINLCLVFMWINMLFTIYRLFPVSIKLLDGKEDYPVGELVCQSIAIDNLSSSSFKKDSTV